MTNATTQRGLDITAERGGQQLPCSCNERRAGAADESASEHERQRLDAVEMTSGLYSSRFFYLQPPPTSSPARTLHLSPPLPLPHTTEPLLHVRGQQLPSPPSLLFSCFSSSLMKRPEPGVLLSQEFVETATDRNHSDFKSMRSNREEQSEQQEALQWTGGADDLTGAPCLQPDEPTSHS
ncbi:unnamed protein product [Pleuronectes platessa]|uniref:Uncharacterized protein n=1 Tax=Pleuronectes platessa TaxID=8262 RepID=A0A9N7ZCJ2_PLEPL|nr:unnamed protein product [Pleuronectes platessa]